MCMEQPMSASSRLNGRLLSKAVFKRFLNLGNPLRYKALSFSVPLHVSFQRFYRVFSQQNSNVPKEHILLSFFFLQFWILLGTPYFLSFTIKKSYVDFYQHMWVPQST